VKENSNRCCWNHFQPHESLNVSLLLWSSSTEDLVKGLCQRASERLNIPYALLINSWACRISTILQKQNASVILDHLDVLQKLAFQQFMKLTSLRGLVSFLLAARPLHLLHVIKFSSLCFFSFSILITR